MNTKEVKVIQDSDIVDIDGFEARRPYYRIRGPRITEQQAFEIIRRTDRVFRISLDSKKYVNLGYISPNTFGQVWFNKNYVPSPRGWSHPNGIIGANGVTGTYPELWEITEDLIEFIKVFPFLDMVVAVTDWNEIPPYAWDALLSDDKAISESAHYMDYPDFIENIEIGFWIHNGVLEIMNKERAQRIYKEYEEKYEEPDKSIYLNEYYDDRNERPANFNYLRRLVAAYGLDPDAELKDFPWKDWLG